jgi:hypothetical protein
MTTDAGELLFERYLAERDYEILAYESALGMRKRPDYLIHAAGHEVVLEVKSFNTQLRQPVSGPGGRTCPGSQSGMRQDHCRRRAAQRDWQVSAGCRCSRTRSACPCPWHMTR